MYYYVQPPYFLIAAGLLAALACGAAFYTTLVRSLNEWSKQGSSRLLVSLQGSQLQLPFIGITIGACVFLSSSLQIFSVPADIAYLISLPTDLLCAGLVWWQLGKLLKQLEQGGSKALNLDELSLGEIRLPSEASQDSDS